MAAEELRLRTAVSGGLPFRPRTHLARISESGSFQASTPIEDHIAWVWWPSGLGAFPLSLATSSPGTVGVFSAQDTVLVYDDPLDIEFTDTTDFGDSGMESFADLVWWQMGAYAGVSMGKDPRYVVLLVKGGVLRYRSIEITVEAADAAAGLLLNVASFQFPSAESGDGH